MKQMSLAQVCFYYDFLRILILTRAEDSEHTEDAADERQHKRARVELRPSSAEWFPWPDKIVRYENIYLG